jgi:hypothetical protein
MKRKNDIEWFLAHDYECREEQAAQKYILDLEKVVEAARHVSNDYWRGSDNVGSRRDLMRELSDALKGLEGQCQERSE